ncbi:hypothetical protein KEM48_012295 [Puccinia striiformis f. sp. tritici PST-130]|nr:hypothetical protein KEM48_012295 [Puccinia striiformis f. sp. tritici PST-130]
MSAPKDHLSIPHSRADQTPIRPHTSLDQTPPTSSASGTGSNPTDPRPQCSFHQSMYANTANGAVPDSRTTTEHGIKSRTATIRSIPSCLEPIRIDLEAERPLHNCHKRGGQITLQAGGKLLTSIRIDVSKSTNSPERQFKTTAAIDRSESGKPIHSLPYSI